MTNIVKIPYVDIRESVHNRLSNYDDSINNHFYKLIGYESLTLLNCLFNIFFMNKYNEKTDLTIISKKISFRYAFFIQYFLEYRLRMINILISSL